MYIVFSTLAGERVGIIYEAISITAKKVLSNPGSATIVVHGSSKGLSAAMLHPWLDVAIVYPVGNKQVTVRNGVIRNIKGNKKRQTITFYCIDYIGFLTQRRFLHSPLGLGSTVQHAVSNMFTAFTMNGPLPITLGKNDCSTALATKRFEAGSSFTHMLQNITTSSDCEFRCSKRVLEVSKQTGDSLGGVYVYHYQQRKTNNVVDRGRDIQGEEMYTTRISKNENESQPIRVTQAALGNGGGNSGGNNGGSNGGNTNSYTTLPIEHFSHDPAGHTTKVNNATVFHPWAVVDAKKEEWRNRDVGDRKKVSLYGEKEYEQFVFMGTIQTISFRLSQGFLSVSIGLSESGSVGGSNGIVGSSLNRILDTITKKVGVLQTSR